MRRKLLCLIFISLICSGFYSCDNIKDSKNSSETLNSSMADSKTEYEDSTSETGSDDISENSSQDNAVCDAIVQAVMDGEDVWLNDAGSISSNGFNECWFQDMNMDGTPEFIVGGASLGAHDSRIFNIYSYRNNQLEHMKNVDGNGELMFWGTDLEGGHGGFSCQLYKNTAGNSFVYVYPVTDGNASGTDYYISEFVKTGTASFAINDIFYFKETASGFLYEPGYEGSDEVSTVTREEFLEKYDSYFSSLALCKTNIKPIPCTSASSNMDGFYDSLSDNEKKKALTDSFNAWSYEESSENKMPFGDIIESILSVLP